VADPTGLLIALLEKLGLVWNVNRVSPERQQAKLAVADPVANQTPVANQAYLAPNGLRSRR
jgi:hypothetical protein